MPLKIFGTYAQVVNGKVVGVGSFTSFGMRAMVAAEMVTVRDENLGRDMLAVKITQNGGSGLFWLLNPTAQMEYGEPAVKLGLSHSFNACDFDHFTAGETKLQPTGADGNAIVCRDCHVREWGLNGWDKLKTYSGQ